MNPLNSPDKNTEFRTLLLKSILKTEVSPRCTSGCKSGSVTPTSSRSGSFTARLTKSQCNSSEKMEKIVNLFSEGKEFRSRGDTVNHVFPINDLNGEACGYLKIGKEGEEGVVAMETLMYYISIFFDISEFFTETNIMKITPRKLNRLTIDLKDKNERRRDSLNNVLPNKVTSGSYQAAIKGMTLKECIKENKIPEINMEKFVLAFFYTIILGMFDVNAGNIIFEGDQIKFFDNTRSLAHSSEFIMWGSLLQITFRSALVELDETFKILSSEILNILGSTVEKFKKQIPKLNLFFKKKEIVALLDQIPQGWLYVDHIIPVLTEKINLIDSNLKKNRIKTCEDLIHTTYPHYKFVTMLFIINEYLSNKTIITKILETRDDKILKESDYIEFWKEGLINAQTIDFNQSIQTCYFLGINVKELLGECLKDNFNMDIMKRIHEKINFTVELDYIDTILGEIEKIRKNINIGTKEDKKLELKRVTGYLETILLSLNDIVKDPNISSHKISIESITDDINNINVKIGTYLYLENVVSIKDILYGLHYVNEIRGVIAHIGNDLLNKLVTDKDERELCFLMDYFYDLAKPDFKDIPKERITNIIDTILENEFRENSISFTKELSYSFPSYIIEVVSNKETKKNQYFIKYKKIKWKIEKIKIVQMDVYSMPGYITIVGKNIEKMSVCQFIKWVPNCYNVL